MAHQIDMTNDRANFAFTGSRDTIWHGLGHEVTQGASVEEWQAAAGMNWTAVETPVIYQRALQDGTYETKMSEEKKLIYRGDTGEELSVVGIGYKTVQPREVLEFFRDITEGTGMYIDTAGCLYGGRRFFASANTSKAAYIGNKEDTVLGNLLLATSIDGTLATNAGFFSTRVVCNNTLRFALQEDQKGKRVRVTHRQIFNPSEIKKNLGLLDNAWEAFIENMNKLASRKIDDADAYEFFKVNFLKKNPQGEITTQSQNQVQLINTLYHKGMGSEMAQGTLWGVLNAVTEYVDHNNRVRSNDDKAFQKFFGKLNETKNDIADKLLELV